MYAFHRTLGAGVALLALTAGVFRVPASFIDTAAPQYAEFEAQLDSNAQSAFGLTYPLTYTFHIPSGSSGMQGLYRYRLTDAWTPLPTYPSSALFNGVAAARFDCPNNLAYLSVPFPLASSSVFLRVVDAQGTEVMLTYLGLPQYYDDHHAAVTIMLDDFTAGNLSSFQTAVPLVTAKNMDVSLAVETGWMNAAAWSQLQTWVNQADVEAASHTRAHTCTDTDYQNNGGYFYQISGSRDDLLANLSLPAPYVSTFVEPCGFESVTVRQAVVAAHYLDDRNTSTSPITFASWNSDGAYAAIGPTHIVGDTWPVGGGSAALLAEANGAFDNAYANAGIYHMMDHPAEGRWWAGSYLDQHAEYISGRTDVW
jgi:hypothetical protein